MQVSSSLPSTERTRGEGLGSKEMVEEEEEMMGEGRYEIGYISEENNVLKLFSFSFFSSHRFVSSLCSESKRFVIYHFRFFLVLCIMSASSPPLMSDLRQAGAGDSQAKGSV